MTRLKELFSGLKEFHFKLFFSLCLLSLFPFIYQTVNAFLVSSVEGLNVIGQMEWYDLIDDTLKAFLIIPLYSVLNRAIKKDRQHFSAHVFKALLISLAVYIVFSLVVYFVTLNLVDYMNNESIDLEEVTFHLQMETIANIIYIVTAICDVAFVVIGKSRNVYLLMIMQMILGIIGDFVLIPKYGVIGVSYTNIMTNSVLALTAVALLIYGKNIKPAKLDSSDMPLVKQWIKIGFFSGIQLLLDNLVYAYIISRMVNLVSEEGSYYVSTLFILNFALVPIFALAEVIRHDCVDDYRKLKHRNYYFVAIISLSLVALTIPAWSPFFQYVEQLSDYQEVYSITIKLFPFYIAFALSMIPDSIFIGTGKTMYLMINSLIINIGYYLIFFILYQLRLINMTMDNIILIYGSGLILHLIVSLVEERVFLKKLKQSSKTDSLLN